MANGASRLNVSMLFLWFLLLFNDLAKAVRAGNCPDFPRQQNCPDSTIDQCKYDEDCKENNQQKCCKIGCRRICFDPSNLALVSGNSMCPALPRPAPCPNQPNQCINKKDCSTGQECCSDGCRMICVQPLLAPLKTLPTTKVVNTIEGRTCNTIVDLAFIIDSSGSISRRNYVKIKNFVKYLARSFKISPTGSRAAVVLYSTSASVKAHFGKYTTIEEFNDMVERLPHERGFTYIDKALELAASQLFPRARKDVPRIAMLLTDGEQTDPNGTVNLRVASAPLRRQGVRLIAFGVGKRINVRELRLAVERDEDVVRVMKFDDLNDKVRNYTKSLCEAAETEPIHPDADIIFLVDTSVGVSSEQFDLQKQFLRRMARYFLISPLGPRAAFATYGSLAYTVIGFSGYSSDADFSLKINSARFLGGTRRIDKALDHAAKMFRDTGRVGLRIVILLTAGNYYTGPGASSVSSAMMPLRNLDAHLYVIGIGSQFSPLMFKQMVREPKDIFQLPSFNELKNWQSLIARQLRSTSNAFKYEPAYFHSDVIFLMDSSSYVGANNYILEKNFVKLMARLLNLANNRTRAALYTFSDRPQLEITFDGYEDRAAFESAVNNAPHLQGSRRIDRAFESAAQLLRTKSRDSVPKYVVLLTSGRQTRTADTRTLEVSSQQVRFYGGRVFVIAILTGGYSIRDFYPAVQRPNDAFPITSFVDLLPRAPAFASRMMGSWRAPNVPSFAADIAFILDSSSLVTPFQYSRAKRFVRILSEYLNVSPGKSRGSFVTYGESPVVVFNFDGYNSHSEFRNKVTNAPYLGGEPSISSALRAAGTLFSDARGLHPWVTILVTPWRPKDIRDTRSLEAAARPLLNRGIWLYVLSIGENPYVGWLRPMIVEPRDAFSVVSYRDLPASIGPVARYITGDNYLFGHSGFQLDILFLMDTSSGVDLNDYKIQKGFVQRIALHLGVFNGKSRAALVAYGANASVVFSFGGYSSDSEFLTRVNDAPIIGGERRVYSALDTSAALLLEARSVMPKAIFLLIAGRQSSDVDSIPIKDAARPLHQLGAWVYVMAIGPTDVSELQKATIRPTDLFFARSFSGLYGFIAPVAGYVANTSVITGISTLNADIVFVIDCSSDVPFREYGTEKAFVRSLIKYLNVQPGQSRVALVTYGSRAMPVVRFESSRTIVRFFSDLTKAPYLGGGRRVDIALGIAMRIFATARENVPKVVLLFMAGKQSRVTGAISLRDSVRQIHQQGVLSFIFRIGSQPEITELYSAVNRPENVISFSNFAAMDARVPYVARHIPFYSAILGPLSLAVDVVYLLDSSNSVTQQHYTDQKTFIKQLSRYLNTMPFRTRGAVITYGSTATVITKFGDTSTTDEFHSVINNAPKVGGPRRMDRAIDTARNSFARARPAVPKVVILLTTGNQPAGIQAGVLDTSFQRLYDLGARLYAVTISSEFIILPLRGSAGSDWFPVRSFISLPVYVVPLARHVSYDTAALGPYDFDADVIFMLDSSSRVTPQDFTKEKEFVKLIARYLNIAPGKSRGSVIVFSTNANPLLSFDGYSSMSEFNIVIDRAPQLSGKRRIDRAFGAAATLFQNARPSVRKIAILLTGGRQSPDGGSLEDALQLMRNRDVTTYVISIGDRSDVPVQRPEDLFYLASYSDLPRQVQAIAKNITKPIARVTTPAPTTPSPTTPTDPCTTEGCNAPYNIGCRAVNNKAQCICPTCPNILKPVCTSDHVQDLSECHMKRQACELKIDVEVEKRGPCDKECRSVMDIAFIIDSSGSIGKSNWERMKRFLKALVSKLDVSDSVTHIAAVAYSDNPEVVMRFNNFQGVDQVNRLFDEMRWQRGFTYTDKALLLADTDLFQTSNGMRTDVAKLAFVITDGKQTTKENYTRLSEASQGIKNKGVTVYALGVGNGVDRAELEEIASSSDYVSTASSFEDLLVISSGIRQLFCAVPTQATKVTTPSDPCVTDGCRAPYNTGCRVVNKTAQCICPTCPNVRRTVCASDDVQDLSECHLKQQACGMDIAVTVAKQAPCDKECSTVVDIAFVVDSSGSIGRSNWERVKRFLKALVSKLDVSPSATHLAVISYSTNPKVELRFNGLQDTEEVNRKLDNMIWQRGLTYTDKALQLANRDLFQVSNGMRSSVPKLALVITDGRQTTKSSYTRLSVASQGMKNKGVIVYAVGVGAGADRAEMAEIASGSNYVYTSNSFKDLQNIAPTIRKRLCQPPTQAPQVTTPRKPDLCEIRGCSAPYNIGCRVVDSRPQCICPTCPNIRRPVCASDDVQDLSECHLKQQACLGNISVTVVKQAQCDKECRPVLDIAFIVDSSGSIGRSNWERVKRFVKALISKLDVSSSGTRVAAISYSTNPEVVTRFISYQGTDHVNRLIDRMRYQRGFTYTDRALLLADRDLFQRSNGMRSNVPKLAFVITDGKQTTTQAYTRLSEASRGMKNKGVIVYAVGVGRGVNTTELEEFASGSKYVYTSASFRDLQNIAPEIRKRLCGALPTRTTTVTPAPTTPDPCVAPGCNSPYNIGCRVVDNKAQCVCPTCPNTLRPVCASDDVQDLSECHLKRQACQGNINVTISKQGPCDKECRTVVDIAFIIDSSGSIGLTNWERMKRFLKALVSKLDVSPSATQIAAVSYSTNPEVVLRFSGFQGTVQVNQLLDRMRFQRGFTYTDKALLLADRILFQTSTGMRLRVPKLAIVITDGKQTTTLPYTRLSEASRGMKNKGVTVYAIGVGSGADRAELEEIASGPSYILTSSSFSDLQSIAPRITKRLCAVPTKTTTSAPTPTTTAPTPTTTDLCLTQGCRAPYNIGCQVVDNKVQCICPTCSNIPRPVCATDGVQDLSECHMRRQACQGDIAVAVAKQGPCDKECRTVVDVAFVIDSSGSIGRTNWEKMKRFLKALVSRLDVSPSATHIAAIAYSNNPEVVMRFNGVQGTTQVNQLLDGMRYQRGFTYIDKALVLADRDLFQSSTGMRPNVPKLALVITDGKQTTTRPYTRLSVASLGIKNKGVTVYALGVGSGADRAELEEIASGPSYVLTSSSFSNLQSIAPRITQRFCADSTPTTKATSTQAPATTPVTPDPCETQGCRAPYNVGCRVIGNKAQCICPTCPNITRPVCGSDDVQDLSECHLRRQACQGDMIVFTTKRSPCDKDCSPLLDIAFIIDSSGSIGRTNWERMKRFLKALVSKLDVSPSATHVAAVAYSNNPVVVMGFTGAQDTNEVNRLFDGMPWQRGFTYTDKALQLADRDLFQTSNGMRPNVAKIAIVITDGKQTKTGVYTSLVVASGGIKNKGVTVYAIGVGNEVDRNELEEIASDSQYVFTTSSFRALRTIAPLIRTGICEDPETKYSANVIFVMDSSSETASIYNTEKDVIKSLARYLKVHPQGTRAALIAFDGRPVVISDFESFRSASDFESVVDKVPHYGGSRSVSGALRTAAGMFPNSPSSVSKVVFLVTSGQPLQNKDRNSVGNVLNKLYAMGVRSYVTLIGPSPSIPDFRSSLENPENVFTIPSRSDIPEQINQIGSQVLTDSVRPYELNLTMYVLFVIDSSAEVTPSNFRQGKEFIKSVISQLNIYPGDSSSRVGIMVYSDGPTMVLDFKNEESKSSLETIIDNLPHLRGARRIDRALKAATDVLRDIDTDHPKFVILVAAGRQTDEPGSQTFSAAVKPLQRTGTKIHVMAVGDNVDPSYFQEEDKNKSSVISVPSFLELPQGAERLSTDILVEYVAPREPKTATPSPTTVEETTPTELPSTTEPRGTNTVPAKVHGGWGPWGGWSKCTKTCGSGTQTQERRCDSPTPENGGRPCNGPRQQSRVCNTRRCPVHGGWGPWGRWSKCTKTCGSGRQTQERRCDNPRPENGGRPCNGPTQQSRVCNTRNCPEAPPSSVDIVFLLDTSNGVNQNDLRQQKDFAKLVAKQIGVAPNSSHAAVFSYSDKPILIGGFFDYLVGKSFEDIVDSVTLTGGKRNIQEALQSTQRLLTSARPDVPRVVFLITYGQQARELGSQRLREMARSVREMRAVLYIIGVGVDDNDPQLQPVVERRSDFFEIPSSDDLNSYVQPIAYYVVSSTDAIAPKDYKAEVIYVVDSSSFVGLDNYRTEKDFVKSLARVLNHGPSHTQSSVIIFDSFLETPIRMGSYREIGSFSEAVNNLRYLGGSSSRLDFALAFAARGFSTNRPDVPKIIIVITNRDPPSRGPIDALADIIRQEGKAVYVIAVGKEADFPNLQRLVVRPEDMYTPKAFADMMSYVPSIASNILALTVPSTTAAATTTELTTTVMTDVTTTPEAVTIPETIATATTPSLPTTTLLPKPTPKRPGVCPTKYTTPCPSNHLCEHDRQCPADEKCCKHSCGFLACTKMVQPNKPGSCPYLPRPSSCSSRPKECNYDIDCSGDLKCCNNGCGKICVSTDHTPTPDPFKGRCPSYAPNQKCPSSVQDECTCDSNCDVDDGYKCCFDGCRRLCRKKAEPSCVQGVDVAFLMDSSESITDEDFEREKNAVKEIARKFLKASQKSRAGVIMYSGRPELSIDFRSQSSLDIFESGVEALTHKRSKTRIDLALRYTADSLFLNPRRSVISIAVVMTDGVQTPEPNVEPLGEAVVPLRSKGVRVLAVGVGPRVNRSELEELVTSQEDVFKMSSFQELLDKSDKLLEAVCPQPPGPIGTTPREAITTSTTLTEAATTTAPPIPTTTTTSFVSTTTPSEPDPKCDKLLDIVFVMDSSRSIDAPQYEQEKNFVKKLATIFNVGTGSRAAVIIYSDDTQLKITFDQYNNLDNFLLAVDELPYLQKRTRIDKALTMASRVIQQARPGFPKVVIVMTDGRQTRDPDAVDLDVAADPIHRQSARVLVVGVGPKISQYELRLIAKDSSYVFTVQSFENLKKATRDVALSACVNPRISTTVSPIGQCPEISDSPGGSCFTYNHTCLSDEQCSSGFLCCFDGCRLTCLPSVGGITRPQATTSPPTGPTCAEAFDLGIAMDSSGSIRDANYQKQRNFIKGLASKLTVGPQNVQLGLIVFSDVPIMSIRFGTLRSTDLFSFTSAVDGVPYFRGRTRIDSALETAANSLFPEGRQSLAPQVLLLITDGRQSNDPGSIKLVDAVRSLRDQSIKVIVIGIGDDVDKDELRSIVQDPVDDLFLVASFEDLARLLDDQRLTEAFCFPTRGRFQRNRS